jgi:condensin complex subunit 1
LAVKFHGHGFGECSSFCAKILALIGSGAQTSIIQNLTYFEHLSEPMAELLAILEKEFDHTQLTEEVLRFVCRL